MSVRMDEEIGLSLQSRDQASVAAGLLVSQQDQRIAGGRRGTGHRSFLTSTLSSDQVAVRRLRSDDYEPELPKRYGLETAFVVTVRLKELPHAELWQRDAASSSGRLSRGAVSAVLLDSNPLYHLASEFDCVQIYISETALLELAKHFGIDGVNSLTSQLGAVDPLIHSLGQTIGIHPAAAALR